MAPGARLLPLLTAALLASAACGSGVDTASDRSPVPEGERSASAHGPVGFSLSVDRPGYRPGQDIRMELRVFNRTDRTVTLEFRDGQRYDFVLEREDGTEMWRWSDERQFIQVLGEETLGPEREELVYRERYGGNLSAGTYRLRAELVSSSHSMSASLTLEVEQP